MMCACLHGCVVGSLGVQLLLQVLALVEVHQTDAQDLPLWLGLPCSLRCMARGLALASGM